MRVISDQTIQDLQIRPATCVDWIKESFAIKSKAQLPAKISVHPSDGEFFTSMPCLLPSNTEGLYSFHRRYYGVKEVHRLLSSHPSLGSNLMLYDAQTGQLLALLDANWITTMRTGAVAAATAKALGKCDANRLGFVGLGNTARATMLCLLHIAPETHFHVQLMRYKNQAELFQEYFKDYPNARFSIVNSFEEMARTTDVLFSCITNAQGLFLPDQRVYPSGITIIPVHMRGFENCDTAFDRVFGDDTAHVCNFRLFNQWHGYAEIGDVFSGKDPGRTSDLQRLIAYNYGIALHDVVFAAKIYEMLE